MSKKFPIVLILSITILMIIFPLFFFSMDRNPLPIGKNDQEHTYEIIKSSAGNPNSMELDRYRKLSGGSAIAPFDHSLSLNENYNVSLTYRLHLHTYYKRKFTLKPIYYDKDCNSYRYYVVPEVLGGEYINILEMGAENSLNIYYYNEEGQMLFLDDNHYDLWPIFFDLRIKNDGNELVSNPNITDFYVSFTPQFTDYQPAVDIASLCLLNTPSQNKYANFSDGNDYSLELPLTPFNKEFSGTYRSAQFELNLTTLADVAENEILNFTHLLLSVPDPRYQLMIQELNITRIVNGQPVETFFAENKTVLVGDGTVFNDIDYTPNDDLCDPYFPNQLLYYGHCELYETFQSYIDESSTMEFYEPFPNKLYGSSPANISVKLYEPKLNGTWYWLNELYCVLFTENGSIHENTWDSVPDGSITIRVFSTNSDNHMASKSVVIKKDATAPIIQIESPGTYKTFNKTSPYLKVNITDSHLDTTWYSVNGSREPYYGPIYINQTLWERFSNGIINITVYANDSMGNTASASVRIMKYDPFNNTRFIPGFMPVILISLGGIGMLGAGWHFRKEINRR